MVLYVVLAILRYPKTDRVRVKRSVGFSGLQREVVRLEGDAACPLLRHRAAPQRTVAVAHVHLERIAQLARHTPG